MPTMRSPPWRASRSAHNHVEGVGVQGAEAFVEEEAFEGVGGAGFGAELGEAFCKGQGQG